MKQQLKKHFADHIPSFRAEAAEWRKQKVSERTVLEYQKKAKIVNLVLEV